MRAYLVHDGPQYCGIQIPEARLTAPGTVSNIIGFLTSPDFNKWYWQDAQQWSSQLAIGFWQEHKLASRFSTDSVSECTKDWDAFVANVAARWKWLFVDPEETEDGKIITHQLNLIEACDLYRLGNRHGVPFLRAEMSRRYGISRERPYLVFSGTQPELRAAAARMDENDRRCTYYAKLAKEIRHVAKHMGRPQTTKFAFWEPSLPKRDYKGKSRLKTRERLNVDDS